MVSMVVVGAVLYPPVPDYSLDLCQLLFQDFNFGPVRMNLTGFFSLTALMQACWRLSRIDFSLSAGINSFHVGFVNDSYLEVFVKNLRITVPVLLPISQSFYRNGGVDRLTSSFPSSARGVLENTLLKVNGSTRDAAGFAPCLSVSAVYYFPLRM